MLKWLKMGILVIDYLIYAYWNYDKLFAMCNIYIFKINFNRNREQKKIPKNYQ